MSEHRTLGKTQSCAENAVSAEKGKGSAVTGCLTTAGVAGRPG